MHGRLIESVYSLCAYCFVHVSGMAKNGSTTRVELERVCSQALRVSMGRIGWLLDGGVSYTSRITPILIIRV